MRDKAVVLVGFDAADFRGADVDVVSVNGVQFVFAPLGHGIGGELHALRVVWPDLLLGLGLARLVVNDHAGAVGVTREHVTAAGVAVFQIDECCLDLVVGDLVVLLPLHDGGDIGPHVLGHRARAFHEQLFQGVMHFAAEIGGGCYRGLAGANDSLAEILNGLVALGRGVEGGDGDLRGLPVEEGGLVEDAGVSSDRREKQELLGVGQGGVFESAAVFLGKLVAGGAVWPIPVAAVYGFRFR